ncbi:MAG: WXG100 family type VII secretion target [Actinobacteria bacterium]|nr:WXG100 family type VII secretion target [Actinomycetota bacterium]
MTRLTEAADPAALDNLARHLDEGAGRIESMYAPVRHAFHASGWQGSDADAFGSDWDGPSRARLSQTASMLREMATRLRRNAEQQREASAAYSEGPWFRAMLPGERHSQFEMPQVILGRWLPSLFAPLFGIGGGMVLPILGLPGLRDLGRWLPIGSGLGGGPPLPVSAIPSLFGPGGGIGAGGRGLGGLLPSLLGTTSGKASLVVGATGLTAAASGLAFYGKSWSANGSTTVDGAQLSGSATGMAGVSASGKATAHFGPGGADLSAKGHLFEGAQGQATGTAQYGAVSAKAQASAMVGEEADGSLSAHVGTDGVSAGASGSAFAGVAAQGSLSGGISGGTVGVTGGVEAGVGIGGEAKASVGWHHTELKLGGNVALGIGAKGSIDVNVDPSKLAAGAAHLASGALGIAEDPTGAANALMRNLPAPHWPHF